ncbi:MAG TPA: S49 family peptidase, partial [Mycobacterium sp.]|nr:S49 family peptidase [Mycobacterium sp.]
MFAFLPSIPGLSKGADEVRALAGRVDTARHHGVPSGCVLELDLRAMPPETTGFDPLAIISGGSRPTALRDVVAAIYRAAEDPRVAGLIARVQLTASPTAAVQELREAIVAFTAAKPSLAWAETYPGTLSYYLASAFGEVWMQPAGSVGLIGFASNATFLRAAFDKAGIEPQFIARGEYKSAANRYTEHGFTEAHREAVTRMLQSVQEQVWEAVAASRKLDTGALDTLADRAPLLREEAVASGLVDRIGFRDEAYDRVAELVGVEHVSEENTPPRLYVSRYAGAARSWLAPPVPSVPGRRAKPTVAVINIDGEIVDGRGGPQFLPFGASTVGSDTIASALREATADESVSAIVLRVNSPGGSVTAAETLWREVKRARKRGKAVVASMGA